MTCRLLLLLVLAPACDVPVIKPYQQGLGETGASGLVVVASDQSESANIGLMSMDGRVLTESILSTASHAPGLTAALGGDIALPSTPAAGTELVVLDRHPRSVLTWVNLLNGIVRAQLSVATGYSANPHDYVQITPDKAYVSRFDPNPDAGRQMFDGGSDVLIIDPKNPAIVDRIDIAGSLPAQSSFVVHPDRARLVGDRVYLVAPYYDLAYHSGDSFVVAIDVHTDKIVDSVMLDGLSGCSGLDVSPDQWTLAVACSGSWHGSSNADANESAIIGLRIEPELGEVWRVSAASVGPRAFSFEVSYVDESHVLASQLGDLGPPLINDAMFVIDTTSGASINVLRSADVPVTLSAGPCNHQYSFCFVADAQRRAIHRLEFRDSQSWSLSDYAWNDPTGMPPRIVGFF